MLPANRVILVFNSTYIIWFKHKLATGVGRNRARHFKSVNRSKLVNGENRLHTTVGLEVRNIHAKKSRQSVNAFGRHREIDRQTKRRSNVERLT